MVTRARIATQALFETSLSQLSAQDIVSALEGDPRLVRCPRDQTLGQPVWKLAGKYGLASSNSTLRLCTLTFFWRNLKLECCTGEARRLATSKGLYLNNAPVDVQQTLQESDLIDSGVAILRAGKDSHLVLALH